MKQPKVVCFGEVLWDKLPQGRRPGGAPMNVAYHLSQLGSDSYLISKVGDDGDGRQLLQQLEALGLSTDFCQVGDEAPTSRVEVQIDKEHQEVKYEIIFPAAWDYIRYQEQFDRFVALSEAFVFGSLAVRSNRTKATLHKLLEIAPYKVFDINLREPFYQKEEVRYLLQSTDLLKLNSHELERITEWFGKGYQGEADQVQFLLQQFGLQEIIVTKGSRGASYHAPDTYHESAACQITVNDTVGSGDAFLAAFLSQKLKGSTVKGALDFASAVGAFITTQSGACPMYKLSDVKNMKFRK